MDPVAVFIALIALGVACYAVYLSRATGKVIEETKTILEDVKVLLVGLQVTTMALGRAVDELRFISPMAFTAAGELVGKTFGQHQMEILKNMEAGAKTEPVNEEEDPQGTSNVG